MRKLFFKRGQNAGVTLLELLVAVAITVIVGGSITGALFSGRSAFESGDAVIYRHENARAILDFIGRDIASAYVFTPGNLRPYFVYRDDIVHRDEHGRRVEEYTLHFTGFIDAEDEELELRLIRYWVRDGEDGRKEIMRYENPLRRPDPRVELLADNVESLSFRFISHDSAVYGRRGYDEWDFYYNGADPEIMEHQRGRIPRAVRITVGVHDRRGAGIQEFSTLVHLPLSVKVINLM